MRNGPQAWRTPVGAGRWIPRGLVLLAGAVIAAAAGSGVGERLSPRHLEIVGGPPQIVIGGGGPAALVGTAAAP